MLVPSRLCNTGVGSPTSGATMSVLPVEPDRDEVVHHLKAASNGLGLARLQLRAGRIQDAEIVLAKLHNGFQRWRRRAERLNGAMAPRRPGESPRVLLVEDNANERELLALLLRRSGLEVDTACDGLEALDRLQAPTCPDMVLLDMGLPRCDGPTTVREIRRNPDYLGLKIFAVSGHTPDEYGLATNSSGIDRWFCKPIDTDSLIHDVSRELALPRATR
ncbi:MAG TPA: response regulator [Gemmataceae bacterium]|jgi:CheY-like chemotaxis protein|nr:response regulator [Gemmataceae bacterium]